MEENLKDQLFDLISKNDTHGVKSLLSSNSLTVDVYDDHGMSPLLHACYKGNRDLVQLLLDHGANVNYDKHEHAYTALHFAALSGKAEICELLLHYGAKVTATNSVGRTASQMAAFVGNYKCVAVINNFLPKSDIECFAEANGKVVLEGFLVQPLHKFVMQVNLHPVRVALSLKECSPLLDHLEKVDSILDEMSEKEMKRGVACNEILSFKLHYLRFIVVDIAKIKKSQTTEKRADIAEVFIKKMLRVDKKGETVDQNIFLKEAIRTFPFKECAIFRQMVTSLTSTDAPEPTSVINTAVNGQRGFTDNETVCWTCGEENASKKCSKCKQVRYCDRECQRYHWFVHKKQCSREDTNNAGDHEVKINPNTIKELTSGLSNSKID